MFNFTFTKNTNFDLVKNNNESYYKEESINGKSMCSYYFKDPTTGEISIDLISKEKTKIIESENKNAQVKNIKIWRLWKKRNKRKFHYLFTKKNNILKWIFNTKIYIKGKGNRPYIIRKTSLLFNL